MNLTEIELQNGKRCFDLFERFIAFYQKLNKQKENEECEELCVYVKSFDEFLDGEAALLGQLGFREKRVWQQRDEEIQLLANKNYWKNVNFFYEERNKICHGGHPFPMFLNFGEIKDNLLFLVDLIMNYIEKAIMFIVPFRGLMFHYHSEIPMEIYVRRPLPNFRSETNEIFVRKYGEDVNSFVLMNNSFLEDKINL